MSIIKGYFVPHPPLIIPDIGDGLEKDIQKTVDAYQEIAKDIAAIKPETIIISSPHTTVYRDYFHISPGERATGDFGRFGASNVKLSVDYDTELVGLICEQASMQDMPAGTHGERDNQLDHATMIPLYFINQYYKDYKLIRIGPSGLSLLEHYKLGKLIRAAVPRKQRVVWIASGDLSHKLKADGPYGMVKEGPAFDAFICESIEHGKFYDILSIKPDFARLASECGLGSLNMMLGAFDGYEVKSRLLSYEGPFGVGYCAAMFNPGNYSDDRAFATKLKSKRDREFKEKRLSEDPYVKLARQSLEYYIKHHKQMQIPVDIDRELVKQKAGVFVTLHLNGKLRGCIGTIHPTTSSIAEEIIQNAISSGTRDYRFAKVRLNELDRIEYSVDVLKEPEPIQDTSELDVSTYGVIVSNHHKSGLLLPNIDSIDTVEEQLRIAKMKAGIKEDEPYQLQRFEVVRHH